MLNIIPIPALEDNYIWLLQRDRHAVIVDPGEAEPVLDYLQQNRLQLDAILCTHRHHDHVGGIEELRGVYNVPVYGRSHPKNPHITHDLHDGDMLGLNSIGIEFEIMETPGHLEGHIVFIAPGILLCGDMIFGGACGKNFEGTLEELHHSLQRLAALPDATRIYCAHEYTEYNMPFALACEPSNMDIRQRLEETLKLRAQSRPTVPFTLATEKATNPFFRCSNQEIIHTLKNRGLEKAGELDVFTAVYTLRAGFVAQNGLALLKP